MYISSYCSSCTMTHLLNNLTIVDKTMNTSKVQVIILIHGPRFAGVMAALPEVIFSQAQFSKTKMLKELRCERKYVLLHGCRTKARRVGKKCLRFESAKEGLIEGKNQR